MSERICLLNDSFPPIIDGVANAVLNYAKEINDYYGEVAVVTPHSPHVQDNYSFPVYRYASLPLKNKTGYRAGFPFDMNVIEKACEFKPELLHAHCPITSTHMARVIREQLNCPLILTYHTKYDIDIKNAIELELLQKTAIKALVNNISACDEVWTVSRGAADNLHELGFEGECILMENGVDFEKGRASDEKIQELKSKHGIENGTFTMIFVGRMMWYKGIQTIIDGLKIIKDRGINYKMLFVGDGEDREEIEKCCNDEKLSDCCIFAGRVDDRELLRAYFCVADLFLFPSTFDTNGIVVREAAACSLPSLLIKNSCAAEGIVDGDTGLLIDDDGKSLAEKVLSVCGDINALKRIGENACNKIYRSWHEAVEEAVKRYEIVTEKYKSNKIKREKCKHDELFTLVSQLYSYHEHLNNRRHRIKEEILSIGDKVKELTDKPKN